jgi:6-phosphogluconolactonase
MKFQNRVLLAIAFTSGLLAARPAVAESSDYFVYVGTYTGFKFVTGSKTQLVGQAKSQGVYMMRMNTETGATTTPALAAKVVNPSYLTSTPDRKYLYAVTEDPESLGPPLDHESFVSAYAIDQHTGKLTLLNRVPTGGTSTCHTSMDITGRYIFFANFGSSSISVIHINPDGSLGEMTAFIQHMGHGGGPMSVQREPHPHMVQISPDNRHLAVSDLGTDKVYTYDFDVNTGSLKPSEQGSVAVEPGGGPRHFEFTSDGKYAYGINEMGGTLSAYDYTPSSGSLTQIQEEKTAPPNFVGRAGDGEMVLSDDNRFLYQTNRLSTDMEHRIPGTVGVWSINPADGHVTLVEHTPSGGIMPRGMGMSPNGKYLLTGNQISNQIGVFSINRETGKLTHLRTIDSDTPVCFVFVPVK